MEAPMLRDRTLIFISHANPADNDFTTWLGGRLAAMGFKVWADLRDLRGGSRHWKEIEEKIRNEAVKVLVVTTRASRLAEGVENEINIAKGIEKEQSFENFIIQLKVDDIPYTQLPPALNNRFAIPFEGDWGEGLRKLAKQLDEERVPRSDSSSNSTELFSAILQRKSDTVSSIREPAFASWLPVSLPQKLHVYTFPRAAKVAETALLHAQIPAYSFGSTLLSFAVPDAVAFGVGERVTHLQHVDTTTDAWVDGRALRDFSIQRADRRRAFNGLLNVAWSTALRQLMFVEFAISHERAHFLPTADKQPIKQAYADPLGRKTRPITLVGTSKKRSCLWHAAISVRAALNPLAFYSVRLHVAFTEDGINPIADGERAFRLRRSFCKSFWNDRWRRLYLALLSRLTDGKEAIELSTGGVEPIRVCSPFELQVPYSIASDIALQLNESTEDDDDVDEAEQEGLEVDFDVDDEDIDDEP